MRRMLSVGMAALVAVGSLVLTGCSVHNDDNVQPTIPVSYVSLYNESPDSPDLQFLVDGAQIGNRAFSYSDYSAYLAFHTGERTLQVGPFGASNVVTDTTVTLQDNKFYSVFVVDDFNHAELLVLADSGQAPATGKAKVRFVNLSPDAGSVQLKAAESAVGTALAFKGATEFIDVDAATKTFTISSADSAVKLNLPSQNLVAGRFYTFLVRGYKTPPAGNTNVLSADVIIN